jgi:pimeloyl-ACP methyl ester carboxylesterase
MTVNGVRLHYVEAGKKGKPLIFFLHGFPEFWYSWRHQIRHFKKVDIVLDVIASVVGSGFGWDPDSVALEGRDRTD